MDVKGLEHDYSARSLQNAGYTPCMRFMAIGAIRQPTREA